MKTQREWCGLIPWLLAASLLALQAPLANAADAVAGASIAINRGESYVIKNVSPDSVPAVKSIDDPGSLIVNKQPDGSVLVVGAGAGVSTVKVTMADGKAETYTITVRSNNDPGNPLAPGTSAAAKPLDQGAGPTAGTANSEAPSTSIVKDPGDASGSTSPSATGSDTPNTAPDAAKPATDSSSSAARPTGTEAASDSTAWSASATGTEAAAQGPGAEVGATPGSSSTTPKATVPASASADAAKPAVDSSEPPAGLSPASSVIPNQAASAASENAPQKFSTDPQVEAAESPTTPRRYLPEDGISMMFGTSRIFDFPQRIKRVSIADSEVADLQVINPHQLMLIGHKPGFTTLAVWDNQGRYEERQVRIEQSGHQQVLLNCTVAEVDRSKLETQGINYTGTLQRSGVSIVGLPGSVATPYSQQTSVGSSTQGGNSSGAILAPGGNLMPLLLSSNITYGLSTQNGNALSQEFFQFLENHDLARILAEPRLLANSGQEAKFLSGGEIPIVIAQALNTTVVFKQFGTSVVFIPTVVGKHEIELVVKPEVSKPDFSQGVSLFGFTVPAFVTRRAETVVRMKPNQTLIIAGLILSDRHSTIQKVPYLGDLPFAGAFFRNTSYSDTKTELVISVTPQIVGSLPDGSQVDYPSKSHMTADDIRTTRLEEPDVTRPRF